MDTFKINSFLDDITERRNNSNYGQIDLNDAGLSAAFEDGDLDRFLSDYRDDGAAEFEARIDDEFNADEVRKLAYEVIDDADGNSAWLREFSKAEQAAMIAQGINLSGAQFLKDRGITIPAAATTPATKRPAKKQPTPQPAADDNSGSLEDVIARRVSARLEGKLNAQIDKDEIRRIAREATADRRTIDITAKKGDKETHVGLTHKDFDKVLQMLSLGLHVYMVGQAGGGKSKAAEQAAEALDVPFYSISANPQTSKHDFFGYTDANGQYVDTQFYNAVKHGGVFMVDEIDAANPAILTAINAAIDGNKYVSFPHEQVEKHDDFVLIAGANTFGTGANRQYVGRNQLDAATLDRFAFIEWTYDEALERKLAGNDEWTDTVQSLRAAAAELNMRVVISPRASIKGATMLAAGIDKSAVMDAIIWRGMDDDARAKLSNRAGL